MKVKYKFIIRVKGDYGYGRESRKLTENNKKYFSNYR